MNFADKLVETIRRNGSFLCAGFDPVIDKLPQFIIDEASTRSTTTDDFISDALTSFHRVALAALDGKVACIKPNIAFFEQYGIAGLKSYISICDLAAERNIPVVADIKRGDIGNTAKAYCNAFLCGTDVAGRHVAPVHVDAITVSPFLGFDTLDVFAKAALESGKGVFVLVRTSNPGSVDIQTARNESNGKDVSSCIAEWIAKNGEALLGSSGYSSLGAVVGATHPSIAVELRKLMPHSFFLIPGYGAQGGSAKDALAGFDERKHGGIVNASRALLGGFDDTIKSEKQLEAAIRDRADKINADINTALTE